MSESYSVIYSPQAKDDLMEIYSYIAFELRLNSRCRILLKDR